MSARWSVRGRGSQSASKHAKPYVLLEAYRLAYDCKSIREQLRHAGPLPGAGDFQAVTAVVEDARDDELSVVCQLVEASGNGLVDALIDCVDRLYPLAHVERAELAVAGGHTRVRRDRLRINKQTVCGERSVDVAQGVHDALDRDASQRPAAERDVEALSTEIACLRVVDREAHSPALFARQRGTCRCDALGFGIEGVDRRGTRSGEGRQPTFAAADVEDMLAVEVDETGDGSRLDAGLVSLLHAYCFGL